MKKRGPIIRGLKLRDCTKKDLENLIVNVGIRTGRNKQVTRDYSELEGLDSAKQISDERKNEPPKPPLPNLTVEQVKAYISCLERPKKQPHQDWEVRCEIEAGVEEGSFTYEFTELARTYTSGKCLSEQPKGINKASIFDQNFGAGSTTYYLHFKQTDLKTLDVDVGGHSKVYFFATENPKCVGTCIDFSGIKKEE